MCWSQGTALLPVAFVIIPESLQWRWSCHMLAIRSMLLWTVRKSTVNSKLDRLLCYPGLSGVSCGPDPAADTCFSYLDLTKIVFGGCPRLWYPVLFKRDEVEEFWKILYNNTCPVTQCLSSCLTPLLQSPKHRAEKLHRLWATLFWLL